MSEIRIAIPDLDLNNALRLDGNLRNYEIGPFDDVVLDFSRMTNFDPLPMLMAGAIIKRFRYQYHDNTFSISGINGKSYAGTMGFFKYLSESISVGKSPGEATGSSNYIPITPISIRSLQERAFRDGGSIEIGDMIERASLNPSEMAETQFYKDELLKCFSKENRKTKLFVYAKDTEGAEHKRKAGSVGKLIDNLLK